MKRGWICGALACGIVAGVALVGWAQQKDDLRVFMRAKLKYSEDVLEGLVMDDLEKVAKASQAMNLLSLEASWQVLQTPEYVDYSRKFRTAAEALTEAAKKGNLDMATVSYNRLTARCVECHKYVRDVRMARVGN